MDTTGKLYRVKEAALLFNVSVETVGKWIRGKKIRAVRSRVFRMSVND